ncbi:MAG: hypothetical protein AAF633_23945 [Chloroflexota bacterium]
MKYGYILYACPVGPMAKQIDLYFEQSKAEVGVNTAHSYMPHCTLTGFFKDESSAAAGYASTLQKIVSNSARKKPNPPIKITGLYFSEKFHGLTLESVWLKAVTQNFKNLGNSPTRNEEIRPKDWLHLSLAYNFDIQDHAELERLARTTIDLSAPIGWELRLYERAIDQTWELHFSQAI